MLIDRANLLLGFILGFFAGLGVVGAVYLIVRFNWGL